LLYWPNACSTALLRPTHYDLDHFDSASVEQAIRTPIKVRSKVALRFAGAWARNAAIVVSATMLYGKLRAAGHATVRNEYVVGSRSSSAPKKLQPLSHGLAGGAKACAE
jgi:hypothetical protein